MSRAYSFALRIVVTGFLVGAALFSLLWAYVEYERTRAMLLITAASAVRIGDTEASILPLVWRYRAWKEIPEPLPPREQWIDKNEYDYQRDRQSDYQYTVGVSPFGTTIARTTRLIGAMRHVRETIPPRLRPLLGMRDWGVTVQLSIRNRRVQAVSAMTLVEGRSEWLGNAWQLAKEMPRHDMPSRAYVIGSANLTIASGGGDMIENVITPEASEEEVDAARQLNVRCLTSVRGCSSLCDFAARALEYLRDHPDAVWNIIPPKCR